MATLIGRLAAIVGMVLATCFAMAAPGDTFFNERMAVQGYLKSGSTGLTSGNYKMQFILKNNGSAVWTKTENSVAVATGLFTQVLSGNDDTAVPLAAALLEVGTNSQNITMDVKVDINADLAFTGADPTFSGLDIVPVPMAQLSNKANNLAQMSATSGQFLSWNNTNTRWEPVTLSSSTIPSSAVDTSQLADGAVTNLKVNAAAAIARTKLASGTADHVLINDGSGVMSSEAALAISRGGTNNGSLAVTAGGALYTDGSKIMNMGAGTAGQVYMSNGAAAPSWGTLAIGGGGTNNASLPVTAGGLIFSDGTKLDNIGAGTAGQTIVSAGAGTPTWGALGIAGGGTNNGSLGVTNGGVVYADGSKLMTSAAGTSGQVLTSAGAASPTWSDVQGNATKSLVYLFEEFINVQAITITAATNSVLGNAWLTNAAITGGAATAGQAPVAGRPGIYRWGTGTTANQNIGVGFCQSSVGGTPILNNRFETTSSWTFEAALAPVTVNANTGSWWVGVIGTSAPTALTTMNATLAGAYFEILNATPTVITPYARKTVTYTGTPGTVAAATYTTLKITYDGTTLTFYKDGVSVGSTTTATNIADSTAFCPMIWRRSSTVAGTMDLDFIKFQMTTAR